MNESVQESSVCQNHRFGLDFITQLGSNSNNTIIFHNKTNDCVLQEIDTKPVNAANLLRAHAKIESGTARGKIVLEGF